jgi:mono/diheme cytochrome c family protein
MRRHRKTKGEVGMIGRKNLIAAAGLLVALSAQCALAQSSTVADSKAVARGRYVVTIGGCNDCHTPGYGQAGGNVPEKQWLTGDRMGWRGPWGTTYASNLRLAIGKITEDQWLKLAKTAQLRPPMPWWALRSMTEQDLRALYHFVKYLGVAGEMAPEFVPPGQEPAGPFILIPGPPK